MKSKYWTLSWNQKFLLGNLKRQIFCLQIRLINTRDQLHLRYFTQSPVPRARAVLATVEATVQKKISSENKMGFISENKKVKWVKKL